MITNFISIQAVCFFFTDKIGGCEGAWQKTNCHLQAHDDIQHFCELLKSFN